MKIFKVTQYRKLTMNTITTLKHAATITMLAMLGFAAPVNAEKITTADGAGPINNSAIIADNRTNDARYRYMRIQGIDIAYREAGDPEKPTILLLHGFPTSSHMYRELIPQLAENYHVIAPDYPGFGASEMPAVDDFDYSFANFANVVDQLLQQKAVTKYSMYLMDYGAPVGFRLFAKHPKRVTGLVIQNGNAYDEGLQTFWDPIKSYWAAPTNENKEALRAALLTIDATKWQWTHGVPEGKLELVSPDNWHHDQYLLDRPGNKDIQLVMFLSYATNVTEYPKWQALFRKHQPPTLIVWGEGDYIFPATGAHPYQRDLKNVEKYIIDSGHFPLETHLDFISQRIQSFMAAL
ncbi:MAG: pimeloyl-ACP methyl ester carboxylesterase [Arenicella sp.]|jgi:pimeloyl-ACP methyl ester carboxylesterase